MIDEPTHEASAPQQEVSDQQASSLAAFEAELRSLQQVVQAIKEQRQTDAETVLSSLQRLESILMTGQSQTAQTKGREAAARWQAVQNRARDLILVVLAATASAFFETVIQEEVYQPLKARLQDLLRATDAGAAPTTAPLPKTPSPTEPGPLQFDWVTIPAGWFLMGSDKRVDKDAWDDELPQQRVWLPEYRIARVPVTVWQFSSLNRWRKA